MAANYALLLFLLTTVSGLVSLGWIIFCGMGYSQRRNTDNPPWLVAFCKSLFPVFLVVFLIRSFVVEPFRIPSESMLPTLLVGDFILVNKFVYGLRLPLSHQRLSEGKQLQRGDVVVFRYPRNPKLPYIKRVVGLPGDQVVYRGKQLYINNEAVPQETMAAGSGNVLQRAQLYEHLAESPHQIMLDAQQPAHDLATMVPDGHYFVLGDNRDYSQDSRYWGFVPESHIVGNAFFIWFHWKHGVKWSRIGASIQ